MNIDYNKLILPLLNELNVVIIIRFPYEDAKSYMKKGIFRKVNTNYRDKSRYSDYLILTSNIKIYCKTTPLVGPPGATAGPKPG